MTSKARATVSWRWAAADTGSLGPPGPFSTSMSARSRAVSLSMPGQRARKRVRQCRPVVSSAAATLRPSTESASSLAPGALALAGAQPRTRW